MLLAAFDLEMRAPNTKMLVTAVALGLVAFVSIAPVLSSKSFRTDEHPEWIAKSLKQIESAQSFRIIPIPTKEHGYNNFASIVFMSKKDLDAFLRDTSTQIGWNNRQGFEDALVNAKLDFSKEALVLLRHTEGSGSVKVTFETPILRARTLVCEIQGRPIPPGYGGTADMAYYCFAVAVDKAQVSQVELQAIAGGFSARPLPTIVLPISEKEPANNLLQVPVKTDQTQACPIINVRGALHEKSHVDFLLCATSVFSVSRWLFF